MLKRAAPGIPRSTQRTSPSTGSADEAAKLFDLPEHLILEAYDPDNSTDEERVRSIGPIARGLILVVSTERDEGDTIRLISARFATPSERRRYADMIAGAEP